MKHCVILNQSLYQYFLPCILSGISSNYQTFLYFGRSFYPHNSTFYIIFNTVHALCIWQRVVKTKNHNLEAYLHTNEPQNICGGTLKRGQLRN